VNRLRFDAALFVPLVLAASARAQTSQPADLRIPAFTAYCEPRADALHFDGEKPVSGWKSADDLVAWYGDIRAVGPLAAAVVIHPPARQTVTLRLSVADQSRQVELTGGDQPVTADFGTFTIPRPDFYRLELAGLAKSGETFGRIEALLLSGPAAAGVDFNLKPRRNAASVHLSYPNDADRVEWFYNEVTARTDPVHSFYMACGFDRGYFGMQVNGPSERRVIFSVWDAGGEPDDRAKVKPEDRVSLLEKGEEVVVHDFGGEGTGGHSHLVYDWKTGQTQRFLLTAKPDGTATIYAAYFYFPETQTWGLIARFRAPADGKWLRGLHSFNENFWGSNGQLQRLAEFGPPWIRTADGRWRELLRARFTHDSTGRDDRHDYGAGVVNGRFYLSNGGYTHAPLGTVAAATQPAASRPAATKYGDTVDCPPSGNSPPEIRLP
jgi:hypothetical protein